MTSPAFVLRLVALAATAVLGYGCNTPQDHTGLRWWKGNLHAHSLWSDGDHYPEMVIDWYKQHGYHFVQLSEHNVLADGEKWIAVEARGGRAAYERYVARFGPNWVASRTDSMGLHVRLKTISEYGPVFEEEARFVVLQGEEITDAFASKPVHLNATHVVELVHPQHGSSVHEVIENNVAALREQRFRMDQPMIVHVNHPNFGWAVEPGDLIRVEQVRFFEVYNGHPAVHNEGDSTRPSTERLWDIVLAERLAGQEPLLYGIAVDDAHHYHEFDSSRANAGRGWIMVRAPRLTPEALISAMEAGDFYCSTGVVLDDVHVEHDHLSLDIRPEPGVRYTTQFIGTRHGYSTSMRLAPQRDSAMMGEGYSEEIGVLLDEVPGAQPRYLFRGDELYVRAKVISSRLKPNPSRSGELEAAWTQPVVPRLDAGR
ncbi:MAG: hypothetical protein PVH40_10255 [Gemmatimonadales bacterium]|jgi:hypothetical protein